MRLKIRRLLVLEASLANILDVCWRHSVSPEKESKRSRDFAQARLCKQWAAKYYFEPNRGSRCYSTPFNDSLDLDSLPFASTRRPQPPSIQRPRYAAQGPNARRLDL